MNKEVRRIRKLLVEIEARQRKSIKYIIAVLEERLKKEKKLYIKL